MIFIFAGSYGEAKHCALNMNLPPRTWKYIWGSESIRGILKGKIIFWGSYGFRNDYFLIRDKINYLIEVGRLEEMKI